MRSCCGLTLCAARAPATSQHNIAQVRRLDVINRFTALTHLQRATGRVVKSMMTDHGCVVRRAGGRRHKRARD